jgi:hypothetical protein
VKHFAELLELVCNPSGFFVTSVADDGNVRGAHLDPSVFRNYGLGKAGEKRNSKKTTADPLKPLTVRHVTRMYNTFARSQ